MDLRLSVPYAHPAPVTALDPYGLITTQDLDLTAAHFSNTSDGVTLTQTP